MKFSLMSSKKFALLISLAALLLLLIPLPSWAAAPGLKATKFEVSVKPEYDDPGTLVIYQGTFVNPGTTSIAKGTPVSFVVPKGASIGMACEINAQGGHDCQPYTTKELDNDRMILSWNTTKDIAPNQTYPAYLEFYYDNKSTPPNKSFEFNFTPMNDIDVLNISVVPPKAASNFKTTPAASNTSIDGDGLTNYFFSYANQTPRDTAKIQISYNKADNKPMFNKPQNGDQAKGSTSGGAVNSWLSSPGILIPSLLVLGVLGALLVFLFRRPAPSNPVWATGQTTKQKANAKETAANSVKAQKKKLRQMLLDGKISEQTYKELVAELDIDS